jgi:hypothetical protein
MLIASISSTPTSATLQLSAFSLISLASSSRAAASSFLESSIPTIRVAGFQDHGGSGERPSERAHSGLVHACHGMMAAFPERRLEAEHFAKALPFGPVFKRRLSIEAKMARAPARLSARKTCSTLASRGLFSTT